MAKSRRFLTLALCMLVVASLAAGGARGHAQGTVSLELDKFVKAFNLVYLSHVDAVDARALVDGAIAGMLQVLGDPASRHVTPAELPRLIETLEGSHGGIGVTLGLERGRTVVESVLPGSPAERAGIRAGDAVLAVDGADVAGLPPDEVESRIRGEPGTAVTLTLMRDQPFSVRVVRETIRVKVVEHRVVEPGVGYLRVAALTAGAADEVRRALGLLRQAGVSGVVLDLRDNPGGYVDEGVEVASLFVGPHPVAQVRGRDGAGTFLTGSGAGTAGLELVVLVNGRTASAAEIVAGAIQEYRAGVLVGTGTGGKGTIQKLYALDGGAIKLTTARYLTPRGKAIDRVGLLPEHWVELPPDPAELAMAGWEPLNLYRTLRQGMLGLDVLSLQRRLNQLGLAAGPENGHFGHQTSEALRVFQVEARLPDTGELDERTFHALSRARVQPADVPPPGDTQLEKALEVLRARMSGSR